MIRVRKLSHSNDWIIEQQFPCINGLTAWFQIATVEEADEASMGYTNGAFGTAEERANMIVDALKAASPYHSMMKDDAKQYEASDHIHADLRLCR